MISMKLKVIFSLIFVFFVAVFGFYTFLGNDLSITLKNEKKKEMKINLNILPPTINLETVNRLESQGFRVTLFSSEGKITYDSVKISRENLLYKEETKNGFSYREEHEGSGKYYFFAVKNLADDTYLRISVPETKGFLKPLSNRFYKYSFFGIVILILFSILLVESVFGPIKRIIHFAREFGKGNYRARVNYFGGGEIELVSRSLNKMGRMIETHHEELQYRQELIESVILNLPLGVALLDEKGKVEVNNPKMGILLGAQVKTGRTYYETFFNSRIVEAIKDCYENSRDVSVKLPVIDSEKKSIYQFVCHYALGKVVIVISDITEQEKLNRLKQQFISDVTHEFKTPISIILGYLDILAEKMDKEDNYYYDKIKGALGRLTEIIDDLVKLEKIEYADLFGDLQAVELNKPLQKAIEVLGPAAEKKNIRIQVDKNDAVHVKGVEEILYYCFYNFIDNAVKYHDKEQGIVNVQITEEDNKAVVRICDDGPGIAHQHRENIFRRFFRVSNGRNSKSGGSGLGLSIIRESVRFHHGKVQCKDTPSGKGICFEMTFPKTAV